MKAKSLFGAPANACKQDYKGLGYSHTAAKNVMIWHVPDSTAVSDFHSKAIYRYVVVALLQFCWKPFCFERYDGGARVPPSHLSGSYFTNFNSLLTFFQ